MLLLLAPESGASGIAAEFPFTIGRSPSAGMRLDSFGVWDLHASIHLRDGRFFVQPEGQALLMLNDERTDGAFLRMGDRLSIGAVRLTVALAPAARSRLGARETLNWLAIAAVALAQVLLLLALR